MHHKNIKIVEHNEYLGWKIYQDNEKIIVYKKQYANDLNDLELKYSQVQQSIASKNMIKNIL